jgi:hypothetical protein
VFIQEPPNQVDFSNTTGTEIVCQARGTPMPHIIWVKGGNGEIVKDVPGLRQVRTEGGGAPNMEDKFGGDDLLFIERIRAI